jgi:hypothetical protein
MVLNAVLLYAYHRYISKNNDEFMNSYQVVSNDNNEDYTTEIGTWIFFTFGKILGEGE